MNARTIFFWLMSFLLLCAIAVPAQAQTVRHTAAAKQAAADDKASRDLLAELLADFQNNSDNATLRAKIVDLAKSLNPAPAIPQSAQDDFAKAAAQLAAAASAGEFDAAARLFEQVAVQAPWYADADFGAASAYAKANKFDGARRNLALYLAAVRPGVDTHNADQLRRDIDGRQVAQFQQALQQFTANPSDAARMHVIQMAQAMATQPEIPEEARGHYVMANVFVNTATDSSDYDRAIPEYKAALLAAPWWGDAYKKLASAQTLAGRFDDAIPNLVFYQAIDPVDARATQDEIYRLKALAQKAAEEQAKKLTEEQQRKLMQEQQQKNLVSTETMADTVEGQWYPVIAPSGYFAGGESNPACDYSVKQDHGRWEIKNTCSQSTTISDVEAQPRQLSFKLKGRDRDFEFSEVVVTFKLSGDGESLEGTAVAYDKVFFPSGNHAVRWMRRK
jgi:tetratricopeptide (TPR) repeat protein